LHKEKNYKDAADMYSLAFKINGWKWLPGDRYNAACCWAQTGNLDSAFFNLERIANKSNYSDYIAIKTDPILNPLHNDIRWYPLLDKIKRNKDRENEEKYLAKGDSYTHLNYALINILDSLVYEDQKWREYSIKKGNHELPFDTLSDKNIYWKVVVEDSLNYIQCLNIFSQYGFPDYDIVGRDGSNNFWILVQHQDDHPDFQECVLEMMKIAVDNGKASAANYA
jgi:hypothetical protein